MGLQEVMELVDKWKLQNTIIELDAKVIVDTIFTTAETLEQIGAVSLRCAWSG
jgi:hypothetical protein